MKQKLVLVNESVDEMGACGCGVEHVRSMAENGADCKRLCALCRLSQRERSEQLELVEDLRIANQHAIDLGCFVSLAFA